MVKFEASVIPLTGATLIEEGVVKRLQKVSEAPSTHKLDSL